MKESVKLVLVSGFRGAGKDTIAEALCEDMGFTRVSFADALREACSLLFGIPMHYFIDRELKEKPLTIWPYISPRDILIKVGTDSLRVGFDEDIWVRLAARRIGDMMVKEGVSDPRFVFPDVRFLNEEKMSSHLKEELSSRGIMPDGGVDSLHIRVCRNILSREEEEHMKNTMHVSDWMFLDMSPDRILVNNATIPELQATSTMVVSNHLFKGVFKI